MKLYKSKDKEGTKAGDCLFIAERNKVFAAVKKDDEWVAGGCELIVEGNKVFRSADEKGTKKESCLNILQGNKIFFSGDDKGSKTGDLHLIIESNKIFGVEPEYKVKSRCQYIIQGNKVFRTDISRYGEEDISCILIAEDLLYRPILLAVLTNFFV